MGLLKKLKKGVKNVFKGVKKVFKKALKFVGKIAASKWGKILMTAASIYMGGIAIYGALQGVASAGAGATFMQTFAAGAKGALAAMASPVATGKAALGLGTAAEAGVGSAAALGGAQGASALGAPAGWGELGTAAVGTSEAGAGSAGAGLLASSAPAAAEATGIGASQIAASEGMKAAGTAALQNAGQSASGGLLSKAAGAAWDLAKSPQGMKLIGNVVKSYGEGAAAEEEAKARWREQRYYDEQWRDPKQLMQLQNQVSGYTPYTPTAGTGYLSRAQGYQGSYQPGSPEAVAAYARGY